MIDPACKIQRQVMAGLQEAGWWFYLDLHSRKRLFKAVLYLSLKHKQIVSWKEVPTECIGNISGFVLIH